MKPEYAQAAQELKESGSKARLAAFDCTVHHKTAEKYKITGFPTIKLFSEGNVVADYTGTRTVEDFKKFVTNNPKLTKDEL